MQTKLKQKREQRHTRATDINKTQVTGSHEAGLKPSIDELINDADTKLFLKMIKEDDD